MAICDVESIEMIDAGLVEMRRTFARLLARGLPAPRWQRLGVAAIRGPGSHGKGLVYDSVSTATEAREVGRRCGSAVAPERLQ
jgi:hypothetical protein